MSPKSVIVGDRYRPNLEKSLYNNGFDPFWLPESPNLDARLAAHADLSLLPLDSSRIVAAKHLVRSKKLVNYLTNRGYTIIEARSEQESAYPRDAALCAFADGNRLIHNLKITDKSILDMFNGNMIHVSQGYTRCNILSACGTIISSDPSIINTVGEHGEECVELAHGDITLDGYDYGFIGGASFFFEDKIYLTGYLCEQNEAILSAFCNSRSLRLVHLTDGKAFDVGGILPI